MSVCIEGGHGGSYHANVTRNPNNTNIPDTSILMCPVVDQGGRSTEAKICFGSFANCNRRVSVLIYGLTGTRTQNQRLKRALLYH